MGKKGFSLVELIVSTLIISILAAGVFGAFIGAKYVLNRARHRIQAFNFAKEVQDKLRSNYKYEDTAMDLETHQALDIGVATPGEMDPLVTSFTYDVSETPSAYKQVTVTFTWDEKSF